MDMKWNPIIDGDLNGIPRDERLLFTGIDQGELYVDFGYINSRLENPMFVYIGDFETSVEAKEFIAWMELPEPFEPGRCDMCKHWKEWIDEYGDGCAECGLIENPPFIFPTEIKFEKCPLEN